MDIWTRKLIADAMIRERQQEAARNREAHLAQAKGRQGSVRSIAERLAVSLPRVGIPIGIRHAGRV